MEINRSTKIAIYCTIITTIAYILGVGRGINHGVVKTETNLHDAYVQYSIETGTAINFNMVDSIYNAYK